MLSHNNICNHRHRKSCINLHILGMQLDNPVIDSSNSQEVKESVLKELLTVTDALGL